MGIQVVRATDTCGQCVSLAAHDRCGTCIAIIGTCIAIIVTVLLESFKYFIHGFYSRWGQLAHLTKLRFFIRKRDRQESDIDKQKDNRQETVKIKYKLSPCVERSRTCTKQKPFSM